ncbi:hypothetical protein [Burkholderia sp. Bp8963]|uniref:hypothetical protein n=1 Tax=Burkholderia sp. Bp8963 TaxID=2184547 RepID=UPI0021AB59CF|nr:hypothetical protein [Burkholderia sp. Bp8963]
MKLLRGFGGSAFGSMSALGGLAGPVASGVAGYLGPLAYAYDARGQGASVRDGQLEHDTNATRSVG